MPTARGTDAGVADAAAALTISPGTSKLFMASAAATQKFVATDGSGKDVTDQVSWSISDAALGSISSGGLYTTAYPMAYGGSLKVTATLNGDSATATVSIVVVRPDVLDPSAASDSPQSFSGPATTGAMLGIVYPFDGTMLARNIDQMTLQWQADTALKVFRIHAVTSTVEASFYVGAALCPSGQCSYTFRSGDWQNLTTSSAGAVVALTVEATAKAGDKVASAGATLYSSPEDVKGGLYYFSTTLKGIRRLPFGAKTATIFSTGDTIGCVGCHAVSRDGKKVAVEFGGGDAYVGILDGSNGSKYLMPIDKTQTNTWNFSSYSPDGSKLIAVSKGTLSVRDGTTGALIQKVDPAWWGGFKATTPEWSPDGKSIAFVSVSSGQFVFDQEIIDAGDIMVMPYNNGSFGAATKLVVGAVGKDSNFYPSWSPDSKWIVFASASPPCNSPEITGVSGCVSYDQKAARLRLVSADGGSAIELSQATHALYKTVTWPKFAPFIQRLGSSEQSSGDLMFLTFSSKFAYGWVVADEARPQLWMSAIDTSKLNSGSGMDPSYPPFWLPFQDPNEHNHQAIWTTEVGCALDTDCPSGYNCIAGSCVPIPG